MLKRYWLGLSVLAMLSPLGLLADGTAWGEWDTDGLKETLGYVPQGLNQAADLWQAIFPDYSMKFLGENMISQSAGYILSAIIGSAIIYLVVTMITRMLLQRKSKPVCQNK